ncbi:MAG: exodeoxyribonuclease III [Rickettsiales bacterium]|nr:exodeoxyribonuclease III [Rickettsiales bacterium]
MISVATWNVNSVRPRLAHLLGWLRSDAPDIVLLQEIKCVNEVFPVLEVEELGYNIALHGQKTYNGVAILSKFPLSDVVRGLPGDDTDVAARYIEAVASLPGTSKFGALRVASVYVPNGQTADSEKFPYKLSFLDRLRDHAAELVTYGEMLVIGGDYNIAPDDMDVHNPAEWRGSVLTHDEVRKRFRALRNLGLQDAYRLVQPQGREFSWWDYRAGAFQRDDGLRIDHLLVSAMAADALEGCEVAKSLRALEKASDHAPVVGYFKI